MTCPSPPFRNGGAGIPTHTVTPEPVLCMYEVLTCQPIRAQIKALSVLEISQDIL